MRRVRLTDESVNSHGCRVITSGIDLGQYERNPVLLYMHERGKVIGIVKNIKVEDGEITAELEFDEASGLSKQCKKQWEIGSLRMVSIGIDILEMSEDPALLKQGQTSPTITRSRLFEVSVVDIGANDNAIVMHKDGKQITLGKESENPMPIIKLKNNNRNMELKAIALKLGLPETADESTILSKIGELEAQKKEVENLKREKAALELAQIESAVDVAISEKRITLDKRDHFVNLGKNIGIDTLRTTLEAMSPKVKLSQMINPASGSEPTSIEKNYSKLSEVPGDELLKLRKEKPEEYRRLYKAEYGLECTL